MELITPLKHKLDTVVSFARQATGEDPAIMELAARDFSFSLAQVFIGKPATTTSGNNYV